MLQRLQILPRSKTAVGQVRGNWLNWLELRGLRITRGDTLLVSVEILRARYRLASLLAGRIQVSELSIDRAIVSADLTAPSPSQTTKPQLSLADILAGRFYGGPALGLDAVAIRDVRYGGHAGAPDSGLHVTIEAARVRRIRLGGQFAFQIDSLAARAALPGGADSSIAVRIAASLENGRFEAQRLDLELATSRIQAHALVAPGAGGAPGLVTLSLQAHPFQLRELRVFAPDLPLDGAVDVEAELNGVRMDRLSGKIALAAGRIQVGTMQFRDSRVTATLLDGRADTRASTTCEGANAEVSGWMRPFDSMPAYELEARADRLPAHLPGLPATVAGRVAGIVLSVRGQGFSKPALQATGSSDGTAGHVELEGRLDFSAGLEWDVRRLRFEHLDLAGLAGDTTTSEFEGTLAASGRGTEPGSRRLAANLELGPSRYGALQIRGARARASMNGMNLAGSIQLESDAGIVDVDSLNARWDRVGSMRVRAHFRGLDLGHFVSGDAVASHLNGTLSAECRGLVSLGSQSGARAALRDGRVSAEARVDFAPSRFRAQEITGGSIQISLTHGAIDVSGNLLPAGGTLGFEAGARPFDSPPRFDLRDAKFADLDLSRWTGLPILRTRLTGSLSGTGQPGHAGGPAAEWSAMLHLNRSQIGHMEFQGGEARASATRDRARLTLNLRGARDTVSVRGDVALGDSIPRGHIEVTLPMHAIAGFLKRDSLVSHGALEARADFAGLAAATAVMEGRITGRGSIAGARLDSLLLGAHLRHGVLAIDTLTAVSNLGNASGSGQVALLDSSAISDVHIGLRVTNAGPLRALLGADTLALGDGALDLAVQGPAAERKVSVHASIGSLAWNQVRMLAADGSARGVLDRNGRLSNAVADASLSRLVGLSIPIQDGTVHATLEGSETGFDATVHADRRHAVRATGRSIADTAGTHVTLSRLDLQADSVAWALDRPARFDLARQRFAIEELDLRSHGGYIRAHGVLDRRGAEDFHVEAREVTIDLLSVLLGRPRLKGTLNGTLAVAGPAAAPRANADLRLNMVSDDRPAGVLRTRLAWSGTRADLDGGFADPGGDSLNWSGYVPLTVSFTPPDSGSDARMVHPFDGDVDLHLAADRFPLRSLSPFLDPHSVGELAGTLDLDARLAGASSALQGSGRVEISGGVIPLPTLGVIYRGIELRGELEGNRLVMKRGHAESGKGRLDLSGEIAFVRLTRIEPRLHAVTDRFTFVATPDLRAIESGAVDITGTLTAPVVKGTVTVERSTFTFTQQDLAAADAGATVRLSDADVRMMEESFGFVRAEAPNPALRIYDASDLDLAIALKRDNWVRQQVQPKLAVPLTGKFQLRKKPHEEPELFGRIEPIANRGYVEQFARSFDITGGDVLLNGKMKDHAVNIQAQYKPRSDTESSSSDVIIHLDLQGSADKLKLVLSSEPAMSDAEIVSYIATGRAPSGVGPPGSTSSDASLLRDIGLSQIASGMGGATQGAVGLDVLQVRFDPLQGATLVAGRYVDPQLYVGFRQPLQYKDTSSSNSSETISRSSFEIEYAIVQWLVFNLQGETSKLRSFFRARYAY